MINLAVVGAGKWALECWAPLLRQFTDRYAVRAVIDPQADNAVTLAHALHLPEDHAYTSLSEALTDHPEVGAAVVLSSPEQHADCILKLAEHGLDVLTEKPLVTTLDDARQLAATIPRTGIKLAVVQNYRYQAHIQAMRRQIHTADLGPLHYAVARFAVDYRAPGSWDVGDAHTMAHPLLVEGSIHHLDMIRYLTGQNINAVSAVTANPPGSSFTGDCLAGLLLHLTGGGFALYEATLQAAGTQNRWRHEHYRLEFAHGSLACHGQQVTLTRDGHSRPVPAPADADMFAGHRTMLAAFTSWLEGGPSVETILQDNLHSLTAVFAAIESASTGNTETVTPPAVPVGLGSPLVPAAAQQPSPPTGVRPGRPPRSMA
jgi:predicted dehydrogenase